MTGSRRKWIWWARRIVLAILLALVGAIVHDTYAGLKLAVSPLASDTTAADELGGGVSLRVTPTVRYSGFHGFLWLFGHTDYCLAHQVILTNYSRPANHRVVMQLTSHTGYITSVAWPPIVRARLVGGEEQLDWKDFEHTTETRSLAIEIDLPPPGSQVTFGVIVMVQDSYLPGDDLTVQITLPDRRVSATGTATPSK